MLFMLCWLLVLVAPSLRADEAKNLEDSIPEPERFYTASVLVGADIYTFGGRGRVVNALVDILKYTPVGANATNISGLERSVHSMSAIYDGSRVFIFGGQDGDGNGTRIVAYNPANDTDWEVAYLPSGRTWTSAVWTGQDAYVFGGLWAGARRGEVIRFNTTTFAVDTVVPNNSTIARAGTSAVWDGEHAYIFAGQGDDCNGPENNCDDIVRYTPANNSILLMGATFPSPRRATAAAWDGRAAYIFGDESPGGITEILRYVPSTDTMTTMNASLPAPRAFTNAVWNGTSVFVLTGSDQVAPWPTNIVRYNLTPGKPQGLLLDSSEGGPVEINSTWNPPASNTFTSPITNYTLTRNPLGSAPDRMYNLGNVTSFRDTNVTYLTTYCYMVSAINAQGEGPPYPGPLDGTACAVAW